MSMMWPPHSEKIVSTPSFLSAFATRWPPETTPALRVFCLSVSSAVVLLVAEFRDETTADMVVSCVSTGLARQCLRRSRALHRPVLRISACAGPMKDCCLSVVQRFSEHAALLAHIR